MKYLKSILGAALAGLIVSGCFYDNEEELYKEYYEANQCDTTAVTWNDDIEVLAHSRCAISGCHVAGGLGNGIFESYEGLKEKVDNGALMERVVVQRSMPPNGPLSDCQVLLIQAWINAGGPQN